VAPRQPRTRNGYCGPSSSVLRVFQEPKKNTFQGGRSAGHFLCQGRRSVAEAQRSSNFPRCRKTT